MWLEGEAAVLRGVYDGKPSYVQAVRVVKDSAEETVLTIWPGAECVAAAGYLHRPRRGDSAWDRGGETLTQTLQPEKFLWHSNRFLIILEPEKYFSTSLVWDAVSREEALARAAGRLYPLDDSWLSWPLPDWQAPCLPEDWHAPL